MIKILVIQQKMIGDVLTSSIICENLKKQYPNATVDYLINTHTYDVVMNNPYIDHFIFFKKEFKKDKMQFYNFLKQIKYSNYDLVIDAYGKIESNLISWFSEAKERISYRKWYTKFLYTKTIERDNSRTYGFAIDNRLELLKAILPTDVNLSITPKIYFLEEELQKGTSFLEKNNLKVNIIINA